jgi:hypothetical protein
MTLRSGLSVCDREIRTYGRGRENDDLGSELVMDRV